MKLISTLITLGTLGFGVYLVNDKYPEVKGKVLDFLSTGNFHTLEVRHTGKQIMETNKTQLLKTSRHKYQNASLKFYPYLLMEVKYTHPNQTTGEGIILWDMIDGEMVVNTKNWEKTHGFGDCINSNCDKDEFKIINLLSKRGGSLDREGLIISLRIENEQLDHWIEKCRRKKLVVQTGNQYRLHLQKPHLNVLPQTTLTDRLVTKPYKQAERIPRRYSSAQIKKIAERAFGYDFAIRTTMDVYLPIFSITVENPDGTLHTSNWNALNGRRLSQSSFIE